MHCNELVSKVDEYLDGEVTDQTRLAIEHHATGCTSCGSLVQERTALRQLLADLPVQGPREDFFDAALANATQPEQRERRPWFPRANSAIAAALALVLVTGVATQMSLLGSGQDIPAVTITMHEVTPVNLQFASAVKLEDARLSLQLPEGVEIAGYTGRKELSWRTDLKAGNNVLALPLIGYMASNDRLVAELDHPDGSKQFELQVTVN